MLAACAAFVCVAFAALLTLNIVYARQTAVEVARRAGSNLAQSLARQASDAFSATDCALLGLAQRVEVERHAGGGGLEPAARERLASWMAMQIMMVPRMHGLVIVDALGNVEERSPPAASERQRYVRQVAYLRMHPNATSEIGTTNIGNRNAAMILDLRRVDRSDGTFGGAVIAEIEPAYFAQIYKSVDVGRLGTIALVADDRTVLVRDPPPSTGPTAPGVASSADVRRLVSGHRLDRYPLTMVVGIAQSEYLAGWRIAAILNAVAFLLVVVAIGLLAIGLSVQIRRRSRAEARLAQLALCDGLTGLANRHRFDMVLEREWSRAARDGTSLALLMIDVDNFKAYNDRYGHVRGDSALIAVAQALSANLPLQTDLAARYGGEEFAVILPATGTEHAFAIGERIRLAIVALGVPHADANDTIVTVSVGVAALAPSKTAASVLVQTADDALYDAKRRGRNRTAAGAMTSEVDELAFR